jgi:hypothetical protein
MRLGVLSVGRAIRSSMRQRPPGSGRKRSWTDEQLIEAVKASKSVFGVFKHLGLRIGGGAHHEMKKHITRLGLDTSHFTGKGWRKGGKGGFIKPRPLQELLVKDSPCVSMTAFKKRLLADGVLKSVCYECQSPPVWRGKPLILRMDHINGDRGDQRLENLRMLCPNCDSQTLTFAGRNKRRKSLPE